MSPLRRLLLDYGSTLNPGPTARPVTEDRAALIRFYLHRWREAGIETFVLTASAPEKIEHALTLSGLLSDFGGEVLSSFYPRKFLTKGDYIAARIAEDGWHPCEQLLVEDSVDAVQSVWLNADLAPRKGGAVAHTLRIAQACSEGLLEEDLQYIEQYIMQRVQASNTTMHFALLDDAGERYVDDNDSAAKCMLDLLPADARAQVIAGAAVEQRGKMVEGRPDFLRMASARSDASRGDDVERWTSLSPKSAVGSPKSLYGAQTFESLRTITAASRRSILPSYRPSSGVDLGPLDVLVSRLEMTVAKLQPSALEAPSSPPSPESDPSSSRQHVMQGRETALTTQTQLDLRPLDYWIGRLEQAADGLSRVGS
eukprot:TRINITY_DN123506_c0_g1_i1.p1 TRINITY_DN123506_c0_g1~~TRINITY_DN123506_c0_g1_i1.p1  ORF type:complete len:369 (-),score=68.25 TRINITY_DN123506_c0_g1_i1:693-1799(-)